MQRIQRNLEQALKSFDDQQDASPSVIDTQGSRVFATAPPSSAEAESVVMSQQGDAQPQAH